MIVKEFYRTREDGVNLYRTYSDADLMILQNETGNKYSDAIDIEGAPFTYTETDEPITDSTDATETDYINALESLGVNFDE